MDILLNNRVVDFKQLLLLKSKQLNITDEQCHLLLIIIMMMDSGHKIINPKSISDYSTSPVSKIDTMLIELLDMGFIERKNGFSLRPLYKRLLEMPDEKKEEINLVNAFEDAFGRVLSHADLTIIESYKTSGFSDEMILDALNEAVKSNVFNFRYIEKILQNWQKNGVKKRFVRTPTTTEDAFDDEIKDYKWWER